MKHNRINPKQSLRIRAIIGPPDMKARNTRVLSYVLVEVGGAPNHERPNHKVNSECKDYVHIIAPSMVCVLRPPKANIELAQVTFDAAGPAA